MSDVEKVAEIIYGAMTWASQRPAPGRTPPQWMTGGNSDAQECARQAARAALSALGGWNEAIEADVKSWTTIAEIMRDTPEAFSPYAAAGCAREFLRIVAALRRPAAEGEG